MKRVRVGGWVDEEEGKGTYITHSTTSLLLHWTHLKTWRMPVRFFLTIFFEDCRGVGWVGGWVSWSGVGW